MLVQNSDFRTNLMIAGGAIALGILLSHEINLTSLASPSSQTTQIHDPPVANSQLATPLVMASLTSSPTPPPPVPPAAATLAALSFQATLERATQIAIGFQATEAAIHVEQTEAASQKTRTAAKAAVQETRDAQTAAANATAAAQEIDERGIANSRETLINVLIATVIIAVIVCAGLVLFQVSWVMRKNAEAKAYIERPRPHEVEQAVPEMQRASSLVMDPLSRAVRIPRNGNGKY